jgi:hypothetical protein
MKYFSQELGRIYVTRAGLYQLIFGSKKEKMNDKEKSQTYTVLLFIYFKPAILSGLEIYRRVFCHNKNSF